MNPRGMLTALSGVFIVAIVGVIIGIIALTRKPLITTTEILDRTIQNSDLAGEIPNLGYQLQNGQVLTGTLFTENIPESAVLGLSTGEGEVIVSVNENGELSFPSSSVVVNTQNIVNNSITPEDLAFDVISSINGVRNNGGNVELVNGGNLFIFGNDGANTVTLGVLDGSGSGLNADLLDGNDSAFYQNASNINSGILGSSYFSAYNDLGIEGYFNFTEAGDIVLKSQADAAYVSKAGDTINGDLVVNGDVYANNFYGTFTGDINGCVTSAGGSSYCDDSKIVGELEVDGDVFFNLDLDVDGSLIVDNHTTLGTNSSDDLTINSRIIGHLIPNDNNMYDLGSNSRRWRNLFLSNDLEVADDIEVGDNLTVGNFLLVNGGAYFDDNVTVENNLVVQDNVTVQNSLLVQDSVTIEDNLTVQDNATVQDNLTVGGDTVLGNSAGDSVTVSGDMSIAGDVQINAQLTVQDLVVSGFAQINVFSSNLIPNGAGYDIGGNSLATRWDTLFITNIDASGDVTIGGTLAIPGYADVKSELDSINSDISTINAGLVTINAELLSLDSRLDELEIGDLTIGGISNTCNGSYGLLGADCTFTVGLPAGKTLKSVSISPMGAANPDVRVTIESINAATGAVGLRIAGQLGGTAVTGLSWVATLN